MATRSLLALAVAVAALQLVSVQCFAPQMALTRSTAQRSISFPRGPVFGQHAMARNSKLALRAEEDGAAAEEEEEKKEVKYVPVAAPVKKVQATRTFSTGVLAVALTVISIPAALAGLAFGKDPGGVLADFTLTFVVIVLLAVTDRSKA